MKSKHKWIISNFDEAREFYLDPFDETLQKNIDPSRRHFDVIIGSHILIVGVDRTVKQYASTTVTLVECRMLTSKG